MIHWDKASGTLALLLLVIPQAAAQSQAPKERRTFVDIDFDKPFEGKIREGKVVAGPKGKQVLEVQLNYDRPRASVGAFTNILFPEGRSHRVGPYCYVDLELYYEGPKNPDMWLKIGGRARGKHRHGLVRAGKLKPGKWQTVTLPISTQSLETFRNGDDERPEDGDSLPGFSIYADSDLPHRSVQTLRPQEY